MTRHIILLVDDEPNILKSLKRLMINADYKILTAESGEAGLDVLAQNEVHLVVSDYRMPGMHGVDFLAKVKEKYPDTMRLILSGFADAGAVVEAINEGQVYKFIPKPWNDQELLITLKRALEQYDLQQENANLYRELQKRNQSLEEMMTQLESTVTQRGSDLELKNRALKIAHDILNLLPVGVIGIDSSKTAVYMNSSLNRFIHSDEMVLGSKTERYLEKCLMASIDEAVDSGEQKIHHLNESCLVICTPLPEQAGVICTFVTCMGINSLQEQTAIK
ncbi:MAG: response regulator [candidate division Zixibacteria bacterium]|nr:response regulator [candidate division Zixibacteria bacterium]